MTYPNYPFEATADLPGVNFERMREMILAQAKLGSLNVLEDTAAALTIETAHGLVGLRRGDRCEAAGMVGAVDEHWLFVMKNAVVQQMTHTMPDVADTLRWSDGNNAGSLPPNFAFVRVTDVAPLGTDFLRVTLRGEDLSKHQDDSIHFRLVIPPVGHAPQWPTVAANGSVVWPDGDAAPHRPVYTTRRIDHTTDTITMDVFIHEGGRVTEWAQAQQSNPRKQQIVGVLGPSGGGILKADRVLMASDETGFPAAARLLEHLPANAKGDLLLEAANGAACAYPIDVPKGINLTWLSRNAGDSLGKATIAALPNHAKSKIWFAGERHQAKQVREVAQSSGYTKGDLRISGFWTDESAD